MDKIKMSKKDFEKEHKKLVKVLEKGSKEDRDEEAEEQEDELEKKTGIDLDKKEKKESMAKRINKLIK